MAKTPFELRYEALQLARDHLVGKYFAESDRIKLLESYNQEHHAKVMTYPTLEELMECAQTLRDFIDGNN